MIIYSTNVTKYLFWIKQGVNDCWCNYGLKGEQFVDSCRSSLMDETDVTKITTQMNKKLQIEVADMKKNHMIQWKQRKKS